VIDTMLDFMDYIQQAFASASKWNRDNSYSELNATAHGMILWLQTRFYGILITSIAILDFQTPKGIRMNISSLATPHFGSSYTISHTGPVTGQLSYLFSSLPLAVASRSTDIPLSSVVRGYRHLQPLASPDNKRFWEIWQGGKRIDSRDTLLYGRIFLPTNRLEGLFLRRLTPTQMLQLRGVSDKALPNGGSLLGIVHNDHGKYSTEYLFSTDSALMGMRGLYNLGHDPRERIATLGTELVPSANNAELPLSPPSLFSLGFEVYYGLLNKSGGISTGLRFTTLPSYAAFPYTMTLTLNPLMGNLSSTYAVKAGRHLALSSRFDFNFYSYESNVLVGCELWRLRRRTIADKIAANINSADLPPSATLLDDTVNPGLDAMADSIASISTSRHSKPAFGSFIKSLNHGFPSQVPDDENVIGVLKARVDQNWKIGLLWEGRFKELLFSVGTSLDLKKRERIFAGLGIEVQYSS
jgi:distribution and morphology protein 10